MVFIFLKINRLCNTASEDEKLLVTLEASDITVEDFAQFVATVGKHK